MQKNWKADISNYPIDTQKHWPNLLRAIATIAVIVVHVVSPVIGEKGADTDAVWWLANLLDGSARFCVPIFLMLSGALLIPKTENIADFYKKRAQRIVWPFLFWSVLYLGNQLLFRLKYPPKPNQFPHWLFVQVKQGISYHLWYIYLILLLYALLPFFGRWAKSLSNRSIKCVLIGWIITSQLCLSYLNTQKSPINATNFLLLSGYLLLGYFYAHRVKIKHPKLAFVLLALGIFSTVLLTFLFTSATKKFYGLLYGYVSFSVMLTAVGVFVASLVYAKRSKAFGTWADFISEHSFGIYLSHVWVLYWLGRCGLNWTFINPFLGISLTIISTLIISCALVWLLKKLPFGKWLAG